MRASKGELNVEANRVERKKNNKKKEIGAKKRC